METSLPMYVDPGRLANRRETLTGQLGASQLTRLSDLYKCIAPVVVELAFRPGEFGRIQATGSLKTRLEAECQRCLQPAIVVIEQDIGVTLVDTDNAAAAQSNPASEFDDAIEYQGRLNVHDLIEDELLLACPIVPSHPPRECESAASGQAGSQALMDTIADTEQPENERSGTRKPFAGLADMLSNSGETNDNSD
ncbi:MAG: YceD family protein [Gammaproteobacteria bacterium]